MQYNKLYKEFFVFKYLNEALYKKIYQEYKICGEILNGTKILLDCSQKYKIVHYVY